MHAIARIDLGEDVIRMGEDLGLENKRHLEEAIVERDVCAERA
jgi:hypothetical protein